MNIHDLYEMCCDVAERKETTLEVMYNGSQAMYMVCCGLTGKKPMSARQWQRKVRKFKKFGLPKVEKANLDDIYAITTTVSTLKDSTNEDVLNGIGTMYILTLKKIKNENGNN
tara:strand:+ start:1347 stop:1685 length:339 start_codon:yes stop_codon:yes gene_type:complete